MALCQGHWEELAENCRRCANLRALAPRVDEEGYFSCDKYFLKDSTGGCPKIRGGDLHESERTSMAFSETGSSETGLYKDYDRPRF